MSREVVAAIWRRSKIDPEFGQRLNADAATMLGKYDLSADERAALIAGVGGNVATLRDWGIAAGGD